MLKSSHQSTTEGALLIPVEFGPTAPLADLHSPVVVSPCRRSAELNTDFSVSSCYTSCHYNTRHERELACTCSVSVSGFSQVQVLIKLCPALFPRNWFRQLWFSRVKLRLCLNFWSFQPQWMGRKLHADVNNGTIPSLKVYSSCCMYLYVFVQMSPVCPPPNKLGRLLKNSAGHWHTWSPGNWLMSQKKWCGVCRSVCKQTESSLFHTNSPFYCCSAADPFTSLIFSFLLAFSHIIILTPARWNKRLVQHNKWNIQFITSCVGSDLSWGRCRCCGPVTARCPPCQDELSRLWNNTKVIWMKCQAHHAAHSCPISHSKSVCSPNSLHHRVAKGRMSHRGISAWVGCMRRLMKRGPRAAFSPVVMS